MYYCVLIAEVDKTSNEYYHYYDYITKSHNINYIIASTVIYSAGLWLNTAGLSVVIIAVVPCHTIDVFQETKSYDGKIYINQTKQFISVDIRHVCGQWFQEWNGVISTW